MSGEIQNTLAIMKDGLTTCGWSEDNPQCEENCDGFDETKRRNGLPKCFYWQEFPRKGDSYCTNAKVQCWAAKKSK